MEIKPVTDKDGNQMQTKDGKDMYEATLEAGDEFIPSRNRVSERTKDVEVENKKTGKKEKKSITNYTLKCSMARHKNEDGSYTKIREGEEVFVKLTPTQAKSLRKKLEKGVEINQHVFVAYKYQSKEWGEQIGIGIKSKDKPPITFDDFDTEETQEEATEETM